MGQASAGEALDLVITNALIVDHWGIIKADIGIKHGRIVGIGTHQELMSTSEQYREIVESQLGEEAVA